MCNVLQIATKFFAESEGLVVMILWAGYWRRSAVCPRGDLAYWHEICHLLEKHELVTAVGVAPNGS